MGEMYSNAVLTSYATFKELYRSNKYKDPYQILSEFIRYIIVTRSLRQFALTEIQSGLIDEFGFHAPLAVISSSTARISGMTFQNGVYRPDLKKLKLNREFQEYQIKNEEQNKQLLEDLLRYAKINYPSMKMDKGKLAQDLINFLLDEPGDNGYSQIIGEYILQRENDVCIKTTLESIREGSILYSGLNYHFDSFDMHSSELDLFLDTEILFDIVGLHGVLYKVLADDFLGLVDAANQNGAKINLKYFLDVKKDIDKFYGAAERIVEENQITFDDAMKVIISGCTDASDVVEKKTQFFRTIEIEHNIQQDTKANYYTQDDTPYNLEAELPNYPVSDESNYEGLKFCSHINKLRKGYQTQNYLDCKFLCISNTRRVVEISRVLCDHNRNPSSDERYCEYAVNLNRITNILWFLLNRGFGSKELPKTLDVVIKARLILSSYISQSITENYKEIKKKLDNKEITEKEAAGYTLSLRRKHTLPEELTSTCIKEDLDFSKNALSRFVEENAANQHLIDNQKTQIGNLQDEIKILNEQLTKSNDRMCKMNQEIEKMRIIIESEEDKRRNAEIQKQIKKNKRKLIWKISWKLLVIVLATIVIWFICKEMKIDFAIIISIIIGIISIIPIGISIFKHDKQEYIATKNRIIGKDL